MTPRHVMILASAGSGKTHALTNRFIALLAAGAAPERLVALTFTRKAAGEFFDKILEKLARAARDPAAAAKLARDLARPELGPAEFLRLLRAMVEAMPRLRLGTLDGFFAGVVRAFPIELGLAGDFEVMEEHVAQTERRRVLRRMFARSGGELAPAQREFAEAFKRATFGREEKRLGAWLDTFLTEHHEVWLAAAEVGRWGEAACIWPRGSEWLPAAGDALAAARELRRWMAEADLPAKQRARWENFLATAALWQPGGTVPKELNYVLEKALEPDAWRALRAGRAVLEFDRRRQELSPAASAALETLVRRAVAGEFLRRLEMTRGLAQVLDGYERVYHDAVRRAGRLGFDDIRRLLEPGGGAQMLTRATGDTARLFIDYRLDAEIDHWLLDEFQDTSFAQWDVLRNLIDEAVQDPEARRSFFCVGDVKQAIFGWRGGDAGLFREIFSHYNDAMPGAIEERHLVHSWRSGPPLIEMVNAVFGDAAALAELLPGDASARWNREWRAHESALPQRTGQAALLHAEEEGGRRQLALELIREIDPLARGLTCAVLVRDNATAAEIAEFLREGGVPAVAESDLRVGADNPASAALLALVQAAAHPGDTLAWEHVQMTPLGAVLAADGIATPEALTQRILAQIHAEGFERLAEAWTRRLEPHLAPADAFTRERLRQFAAAAGAFDATGSSDVAEFVAFMQQHTVRDGESDAVVRVMTIHKSKGLGFDVVVLPELEGNRLDQKRDGLAVQRAADRAVEWVLDLPSKPFLECDPVLAEHAHAAEAVAGYENLALLYVAMTRAQRAMFVLVKPPGKSESRNFPRLLTATLGDATQEIRVGARRFPGAWSSGDPEWHRAVRPAAKAAPVDGEIPAVKAPRAPRHTARRPSSEKRGRLEAARLFALANDATDFGRAVHALFEKVEWLEAGAVERYAAEWAAHGLAAEQVLACLREPKLAAIWMQRPGADVWRERAFETVLDGVWMTGVFDRVVVERDLAGEVVGATVYDFKTDRVTDDAAVQAAVARHTPQLNIYRRVAAMLVGIPRDAVECELVFTLTRQRERVPRA